MKTLSAREYLSRVKNALANCDPDIDRLAGLLAQAKFDGRTLWILGNGGSLAIAQHTAQDLVKAAGMRAIALNCPSVLSAYTNDEGFERAAFGPVNVLAGKEDPVLIFSCSGRSRNYIEFVSGFPDEPRPVFAVVGTDGGFLREKAQASVHVKSEDYAVCEAGFGIVADIIVKAITEAK